MKSHLRGIALCCATSMAVPTVAWGRASQPAEARAPAQSESLAEAEALYKRGRTSFETANYIEAIALWSDAYGLVEDVPENAAIKAALIYNIAAAQEKAYDIDTDITHLRQAEVLMETYAKSVPNLYGEGPEGEVELEKVQTRLAELRVRIEEAEAALPERSDDDDDRPPEPEPAEPVPDPKAKPLIIAGAVTAGLGLAGLGVMAGGLAMGSAANELDADQSIPDRRSQFDRGRMGNTLAYVGGAAGGVLLVTGAVLLGLGLKKRSAGTMAVEPFTGRRTAGLRVTGRF